MSGKAWTTDEIAADIDKESKFKAPEQIDIQTRLARRVVELKAKLDAIGSATSTAASAMRALIAAVEGEGGG